MGPFLRRNEARGFACRLVQLPEMPEGPTFFCIGAARSGTTWAWECLRHHPEVEVTQPKETDFFTEQFERGESWFLSHFSHLGERLCGEVNPGYLHSPEAAKRIAKLYPGARLVVILREPLERSVSHVLFRARGDGVASEPELLRQYATQEMIDRSCYYTALSTYRELFGKEQIRILFYDHLKASPETFQAALYQAVGADPGFQFGGASKVVNKAKELRFPRLFKLLRAVSAFFKRHRALSSLLERLHRLFPVRRLVLDALKKSKHETPPIHFLDLFTPEQAALLKKELKLLQRDWELELPERWNAG